MTNFQAQDVVAAARRCIGTPYHHQARKPGIGLDCVGLVICVARQIGAVAPDWDVRGYSRVPDGFALMRHLEEQMDLVQRGDMRPGDVVCVEFDNHPQHVGVLGDYVHGGLSIIHASNAAGRVIETRLLFSAAMRFVSAHRYRGV